MALRDISFFAEDTDYRIQNKQKLRQWIAETIAAEGFKRIGPLNFIYTSDVYLLEINKQYLNHDTFTDIVTFDHSDDEGRIAGDIFISVDRVRENATTYAVTEWDELCRVLIHGVLHLCGFFDKSKDDKAQMTAKENHYLSLRKF